MRSASFILASIFAAALAHAEAPAIHQIPSAPSLQAVYAGSAAGTEWSVRGGDGGQIVIDEAALITAQLGSPLWVLDTADGQAHVRPEKGGFRLRAGSAGLLIDLADDHRIELRGGELLLTRLEDEWLVQLESLDEGGSAQLIDRSPAAPAAPEPAAGQDTDEGDPAPSPAVPTSQTIETGAPMVLPVSKPPRPANKRERRLLARTRARLAPPTSGGRLEPAAVEDPADLLSRGPSADAALGEIELEDVEVEAGCVEICID